LPTFATPWAWNSSICGGIQHWYIDDLHHQPVASSASSAKPPSNAKQPKTPPRTFFPDDDYDWGNWKVKLLGKEDRKDEQDEK
jgi:hypothetical protein